MISLDRVVYFLVLAFPVTMLAVKPLAIIIFVLISLLGIILAFKHRINPLVEPSINYFSWLTIGYFSVMAISVIMSNEPTNDWRHLSRIAYFLFAPFIAVSILNARVSFEKIVLVLKLGVIIAGAIVFVQILFFGASGRVSGMYNPNTFGDIVVIMMYLSLSNIAVENKNSYILSLIVLFFGVSAVVQSGSRGSMLAFFMLLPVFMWIAYRSKNILLVKRAWIAFAVILTVFFSNYAQSKMTVERVTNIGNEIQKSTSSAGQRIEMYRAGWKSFLDAPIFGYGYRNSNKVASRYIEDTKVKKLIEKYSHLHNEFLTHMVNAGVVGLLSYLAILLLPVYFFIKKRRESRVLYMVAMLSLSYLLLGLTHGMFGYAYEGALYVMILAYIFTTESQYSLEVSCKKSNS